MKHINDSNINEMIISEKLMSKKKKWCINVLMWQANIHRNDMCTIGNSSVFMIIMA